MICPACNALPGRLCISHARTDNLTDEIDGRIHDLELERDRARLLFAAVLDALDHVRRNVSYDSLRVLKVLEPIEKQINEVLGVRNV